MQSYVFQLLSVKDEGSTVQLQLIGLYNLRFARYIQWLKNDFAFLIIPHERHLMSVIAVCKVSSREDVS